MPGLSFAFDTQSGETPEMVARRRAVAEALLARSVGAAPQNIGEGLNALGAAIGGRLAMDRATRAESAGRARGDAAFADIMGGFGGGGGAGGSMAPLGPAATPEIAGLEGYIRNAAADRGIDPDVAVRVARSEGLAPGVWQSNVVRNGKRETSYGPYQLLVGGGLGDKFARKYGVSPADPSSVYDQIDFALDEAAAGGWSPWYGAAKVGVGNRTGLENARPLRKPPGSRAGGAPAVTAALLGGGGGANTMIGASGGDTLSGPIIDPAAKDDLIPQPVAGGAPANPPNPPARPDQIAAVEAALSGGAGTDTLLGGTRRPMGVDPFTRRGPAFDRVANAGHDSLAPGGGSGVAAVAQALAPPRPPVAPVAAPPAAGGMPGGGMVQPAPSAPAPSAPAAPPMVAPGGGGGMQPPAGTVAAAASGPDQNRISQLMQAAANPWLTDAQQGVVMALLKQEMAKADPTTQLEIQKTLAEIDKLKRPDTTTVGNRVVDQNGNVIYEGPQEPTTGMKDYDAYAADVVAAGGTPLGRLEYEQAVRKAGATSIDNRQMGTIPPGYRATYDANGNVTRLDPIEGGPAAQEAEAAATAADAGLSNQADKAETMLGATAAIKDEINSATMPATGTLSQPFAVYSGSAAGRIRSLVKGLQSGVALQAMQKLKEASATGATGFGALSEKELSILINQIGALDPDNTEPDIFLQTIDRIETQWKRTLANVKRTVPPDKLRELGIDIDALMAGPQAVGDDGIPTVSSVEEAAKLPPGTRFRTPDGRIKVRP